VGIKYLLDSVIVIDHLNGRSEATEYIAKMRHSAALSVVTRAEVLVPYDAKQTAPILRLLDAFPALAIDAKVADCAALLRREHKWKLPDAFQAALAQQHDLKLVTRNTKDFPPEKFKFVVVPYA
jgi:predicted nucleic acid-binding protein